ncbi:MAG TPA: FlgD immunoglobulin-like domain containing protein [Bacteroidota bacterium]|jgi:hypothetical protein|nr:FlgD immunoglobulin-like domain containing protein [Bacteroidota bacterium]
MKNNIVSYLILMAIGSPCSLFSQNTVVPFSAVTTGFEVSPSTATTVTSAVGQAVVDDVQQLNTHVESGFLVYSRSQQPPLPLSSASDSIATAGQQFDVKFPISPNLLTFAESLYYRRGGEYNYAGDTLQRDVDTLRGKIPSSYATIRGIEYYIILRVSGSTVFIVTYPPNNPVDAPATIPVSLAGPSYPINLQRKKYTMVSIPLDLNAARRDIFSVLADDYGGTYSRNRWRVFRWEQGDYAEYPVVSASFTPGTSFWLVTQSGFSFTTGPGQSVFPPPGAGAYPIVLESGWNQIANPFAYPVSWTSIIQNSQISDTTISRPNYYDGDEYAVADILQPWGGYFVYNTLNRPVTLFVPPKETVALAITRRNQIDGWEEELMYAENFAAEIPELGLKDSRNLLGFWKEAAPSRTRINDREPPPIGEYLRLSIVDGGKDFMTRVAELPVDGLTWEVEVSSTSSHQVALVTLSRLGKIPEGFQLYVLDKDNLNSIPLTEGRFSLQLGEPFHKSLLKVIVGTKEYAEQQGGGIPLVPLSHALEQNYPNPFNPGTQIRYQLSGRSGVRLEIFDIAGRRVRSLVDAVQLTGVYTFTWDGRNDAGTEVASGMYIYRLRAVRLDGGKGKDFTATRKLILVR